MCVLRFLSESSLLILISSLCTLSDESLQNKVDTVFFFHYVVVVLGCLLVSSILFT